MPKKPCRPGRVRTGTAYVPSDQSSRVLHLEIVVPVGEPVGASSDELRAIHQPAAVDAGERCEPVRRTHGRFLSSSENTCAHVAGQPATPVRLEIMNRNTRLATELPHSFHNWSVDRDRARDGTGVYAPRGANPTANTRDNIFADSLSSELATVSGDPASGLTATFRVAIAA